MKPYKVTVVVTVQADNLNHAEQIVKDHLNDTDNTEITYVREVPVVQHMNPTTPTVPPMAFDKFSAKYSKIKKAAGDDVGDLTAAYAIYCNDPAGHWISKE